MKKSILAVLLVACAAVGAKAQTLTFGVKGGLNVAKLTNIDDSHTRASIYAGGFANFALNDMFAIQPELLYSGQGYYYRDAFDNKYTTKLGYINIPVMFQVHLVEEFFLEAGPQVGFLASAKAKAGKVTVDIKDDMSTADFGVGFGLGYQFPIGVGVTARYMFGLTDAYKNATEAHKNSVASIGLTYTFNKKFKL
ncbi:porin family protein [Chitinophaga silvisoli]|uniref:PorT family protein n=1 Tax=Chitinophaga silvisoli TaxID=2291814 RepID=A0A3E1P946_9BACT|nr:porin family protein [Chitinophaga silvisoli]RFM36610.1 PorT family protein [Chitinophaga silvisoli]